MNNELGTTKDEVVTHFKVLRVKGLKETIANCRTNLAKRSYGVYWNHKLTEYRRDKAELVLLFGTIVEEFIHTMRLYVSNSRESPDSATTMTSYWLGDKRINSRDGPGSPPPPKLWLLTDSEAWPPLIHLNCRPNPYNIRNTQLVKSNQIRC
jgi:hypothetical protein